MKQILKIGIIGGNVLEQFALTQLISDMSAVSVQGFCSFSEFKPHAENFDAFIANAETFSTQLDFFLPRKQKCMLLLSNDDSLTQVQQHSAISVWDDQTETSLKLKRFIDSLESKVDVSADLSSREIEVLRLVAAGKINKEIADALCISTNTVITHRKNISSKLGIKSTSGLSLYALMNGLL